MPIIDTYLRVSHHTPCPICGRTKWCLISRDGRWVICPRTEQGALRRSGDAGWLHRMPDQRIVPPHEEHPVKEPPALDAEALARECYNAIAMVQLLGLAKELGVPGRALQALRVGWHEYRRAYSFPMRNAKGGIIGIRLRLTDPSDVEHFGTNKIAVRGSRAGLFWVPPLRLPGELLVCEGPTDAAALMGLGFEVVGRPSCTGGSTLLVELCALRKVRVIADRDESGIAGAKRLADKLIPVCPEVRVTVPPVKDAREWVAAGATRSDIEGEQYVTQIEVQGGTR